MTIPAEMLSGTGTFTFTPMQDVLPEGAETISVEGVAMGFEVKDTKMTLTDDEMLPWPSDGLLRLVNEDVSVYGADDCREFAAANPNLPDMGKPVTCPADREGRVEIAHGGVFGTVSDDYWTDVEGERKFKAACVCAALPERGW